MMKRTRPRYEMVTIGGLTVPIDTWPQPVYKPVICAHCNTEKAPMVGCKCDWGDGEDSPPDGRSSD
jgi:hypothetical protein